MDRRPESRGRIHKLALSHPLLVTDWEWEWQREDGQAGWWASFCFSLDEFYDSVCAIRRLGAFCGCLERTNQIMGRFWRPDLGPANVANVL